MTYDEFDLDLDFEDGESNAVIDAMLEQLQESVNNSVTMLNPKRMAEAKAACAILAKVILDDNPDAKFKVCLDDLFKRHLEFHAEAISFDITNMEMFLQALRFANNVSFYPKKNGNGWFAATFRDCYVKIGSLN